MNCQFYSFSRAPKSGSKLVQGNTIWISEYVFTQHYRPYYVFSCVCPNYLYFIIIKIFFFLNQKYYEILTIYECVGLGASLVERSFFPENERNDQEPSQRSEKKTRLEHILKNIETISKRTERNGTGMAWKERLKSLTRSYYQERVLSRDCILNQACVLNPLEIVKDCLI